MSNDTSSLTATVALLASPSRYLEIVEWVNQSVASLNGCSLLAPRELADRLIDAQKLALDSRLLSLRVDSMEENDAHSDVRVAGMVLSGQVRGVIIFKDFGSNHVAPDLHLLARVCDTSNTPLALNKVSADLMLRSVAETRVCYLIFNPAAGQGESKDDLKLIQSILEPAMILHVVATEKDRDVVDQVKEVIGLIQSSPDYDPEDASSPGYAVRSMIVASGGDGTVSAVAGATMSTGIPFGAIPRGTANAFSVALGIPTKVDEACRTILTGKLRVIDGGLCNDSTPFINLAGVGFEAGLVDNATRELKNVFGNLAYVLGAGQQALQQEPFTCQVQIDDQEEQTITTKVVTVANVAPSSSVFAQGFGDVIPDDGLLEVTIASKMGTLEELETLANLWASSVVKSPVPSDKVLRVRAKKITVNCDPPQKLLLDGEVLETNPVTFKVVPKGLTVIVPTVEETTS